MLRFSKDTHNHINIKQQPHDAADAARLYGELQQKAEETIREMVSYHLPNINAEFVTLNRYIHPYRFGETAEVCFKLNGMTRKIICPLSLDHSIRPEELIGVLAKEISNDIVEQMVPHLIEHSRRRF